jgi:hypothetical protein
VSFSFCIIILRSWILTAAVVAPSENGVENAPSESVSLALGVTAAEMPDVAYNIIGAGAVASFRNVSSNLYIGRLLNTFKEYNVNLPWY